MNSTYLPHIFMQVLHVGKEKAGSTWLINLTLISKHRVKFQCSFYVHFHLIHFLFIGLDLLIWGENGSDHQQQQTHWYDVFWWSGRDFSEELYSSYNFYLHFELATKCTVPRLENLYFLSLTVIWSCDMEPTQPEWMVLNVSVINPCKNSDFPLHQTSE